jgi:hypothetical protein
MRAEIARQARALIRSGKTRQEAAIYLGVSYDMVVNLTKDIKLERRKYTQRGEYAERESEVKKPTKPIGFVSREERVELMRQRAENNEELWHAGDCPWMYFG